MKSKSGKRVAAGARARAKSDVRPRKGRAIVKPASKSARPIPESAREYLQFIGAIGGCSSRRDLAANQARRMVAIREAKRALIKQGKSELTWERWPLKVKAHYTDIRRRVPQIRNEWRPFRITKKVS